MCKSIRDLISKRTLQSRNSFIIIHPCFKSSLLVLFFCCVSCLFFCQPHHILAFVIIPKTTNSLRTYKANCTGSIGSISLTSRPIHGSDLGRIITSLYFFPFFWFFFFMGRARYCLVLSFRSWVMVTECATGL